MKNVGIDIYNDHPYTVDRLKKNLANWGITLSKDEVEILLNFTINVTAANELSRRPKALKYLSENIDSYLEIIEKKFLPAELITFDAIILFARKILKNHPGILEFYKAFFPVIIVDEFQDTNILQWALLQDIAGRQDQSKNNLFIFGDRFQKIYDFIGAMDGVIDLQNKLQNG
ncbi:MAG: UvrD-helicase domain-containing protein [Anaerolineales bacterium]|nr:UvrD-helicase domain-containing protein [Anaerolineales bacterium]